MTLRVIGIGIIAVTGTRGGAAAQTVASILQATLMEANQQTPEITTEEFRKILVDGSATVFDARPFKEYAVSHVPGALNVSAKPGVPMSLYVSDVAEIGRRLGGNKSAPIVLYCNGPFCGKSKRLAEELLAAGFTNIRRYQLGIPVWRALVGTTEIELEGVLYVYRGDKTAVLLDARDPAEFAAATVSGAVNIAASLVLPGKDVGEVKKAKDDGRLPMEDHNTRIIGGADAIDQLAALRAETDGTIGVGGATVATQLLRAGLLDEFDVSLCVPSERVPAGRVN